MDEQTHVTLYDPTFVDDIPIPNSREQNPMLTETHHSSEDIQLLFDQQAEMQKQLNTIIDMVKDQRNMFLTVEDAKRMFASKEDTYTKQEIDRFVNERDEAFEVFGDALDKVVERVSNLVDEKIQENEARNETRLKTIVDGFTNTVTSRTREISTGLENVVQKLTDWRETSTQRQNAQDERIETQGKEIKGIKETQDKQAERLEEIDDEATLATTEIRDFKQRIIPMTIAVMGDKDQGIPSIQQQLKEIRGYTAFQNRGGIGALILIAATILAKQMGIDLPIF